MARKEKHWENSIQKINNKSLTTNYIFDGKLTYIQFLKKLKSSEIIDNTYIVFSFNNGVYEEAIRYCLDNDIKIKEVGNTDQLISIKLSIVKNNLQAKQHNIDEIKKILSQSFSPAASQVLKTIQDNIRKISDTKQVKDNEPNSPTSSNTKWHKKYIQFFNEEDKELVELMIKLKYS